MKTAIANVLTEVSSVEGSQRLRESAIVRNWHYVTDAFEVRIPVRSDDDLRRPEEDTLAILRWRLQHMNPVDRWYPVLERYVSLVKLAARTGAMSHDAMRHGSSRPAVPPGWSLHITVQVDAHAVYALTGPDGTAWSDYLPRHWQYPRYLRLTA